VRDRRLCGYKFKRQVLIGPYIADFVCTDRKVIVELDGGQHADNAQYDHKRDTYLLARGYLVVRFWNVEFIENPDGVLNKLVSVLDTTPSPQPSPPAGARE